MDTVTIHNHSVIKVHYEMSDIEDVFLKAQKLANDVNEHDPAGNVRDYQTRLIKNLSGLLSEKAVSDIVTDYVQNNKINAKIDNSQWKEGEESALYQIDHSILFNGGIRTIETRSSFSYITKKCPDNVIGYAFSLIGPYVTQNKAAELEKDFYAFVFLCVKPDALIQKIEQSGIDLYFAGGATFDMFKSHGKIDTFKQTGAKYLAIKPITDGLSADSFLAKLFS